MAAARTAKEPGAVCADGAAPDEAHQCCPFFQHAVELIGRRWTGAILHMIGDEALRFGEIRGRIPGLSDRLLDARLTELEAEGIIERREENGEARYSITPKGDGLGPVFDAIGEWAQSHADVAPELPGRRRT